MRLLLVMSLCGGLTVAACSRAADPVSTPGFLPAAGWDHRPEAPDWTAATIAALKAEGAVLVGTVPSDIGAYCPGYAEAKPDDRRAFWVGLLSVVARHESGWNPHARGGGGRFLGLLQISKPTAEAHGCGADTLLDGAGNLSCGVRIIAGSVARDGVLFEDGSGGWGGIARDWLPFRDRSVRLGLADWTAQQSYCRQAGGLSRP